MAVEFNIEIWRELYPQFDNLSDTVINSFITEANMLVNVNCFGDVIGTTLLNNIIAHFSQLRLNGTVGRTNTATQGSVSVGLEYNIASRNGSWWNQTPYGAFVWQYLSSFMGAFYVSS